MNIRQTRSTVPGNMTQDDFDGLLPVDVLVINGEGWSVKHKNSDGTYFIEKTMRITKPGKWWLDKNHHAQVVAEAAENAERRVA